MIATSLEKLSKYKVLGSNLATAIAWLEKGGWDTLADGRYEVDGTAVYALVSHYNTKTPEAARYETHKDYIDIQLLVSGREILQVRKPEGLVTSVPYKPDIEFYATPEPNDCHAMLLEPGVALVLYPEDAHRPGLAIAGSSEPVHKLVLKVAL